MCGVQVQWLHAVLIGPSIILATAYGFTAYLYVLGGVTTLLHLYFLFTGANAKNLIVTKAKSTLKPSRNIDPELPGGSGTTRTLTPCEGGCSK